MKDNIKLPSNKRFGLFFSFIFLCFSLYFFLKTNTSITYLLFSLSIIFLFFALFFPNYLFLLNKGWMLFGLLLSKIINPLILGIIYFGLFTPIGFLKKIISNDELNLKLEVIDSYWRERKIKKIKPDSFKDQF